MKNHLREKSICPEKDRRFKKKYYFDKRGPNFLMNVDTILLPDNTYLLYIASRNEKF